MGLVEKLPTADDDMPPPSPELVIMGVYLVSCIRVGDRLESGQIKAKDFKRALTEEFDRAWRNAESARGIVRLRSSAHDRELARAQRQAKAWFDKLMTVLEATR